MERNIPTREEMQEALIKRHGAELQKRFCEGSVAICGLGGLGSNVAISLARAGVGRLHLIDFDCVDLSNMNRQQYQVTQIGMPKTEALAHNLAQIAPYVDVKIDQVKVTPENLKELLKEEQIICEAFDVAEQKAMLVNGVLSTFPDKFLVAASGMAGMDCGNLIQTKRMLKRFYMCGDGVSDVADGIGLVAPRVMLCAAQQAHTILRILAGQYEV
ncbi:MAG: sulfur carrier protein ThiS adenylyltransferase ThiF [Eubacteriales bacterium]|nr:sulfur carrier protein ThiS adenylyltransferase ThiF [Eubacteriales bacterium]